MPTLKSEETTTPYPTDEEATECGDSCGEEEGMYQKSTSFISVKDGFRAKKALLSSYLLLYVGPIPGKLTVMLLANRLRLKKKLTQNLISYIKEGCKSKTDSN